MQDDMPPLLWRDMGSYEQRLLLVRKTCAGVPLEFLWIHDTEDPGPLLVRAPPAEPHNYVWLCRVERPGPLTPEHKVLIETLAILRYNLQEMI